MFRSKRVDHLISLLCCTVWLSPGCSGDAPAETTETDSSETDSADATGSTSGDSETDGTTGTASGETATETESVPDPFCGDGQINADEQCDDGDDVDLNGCNTDCRITGEKQWEIVLAVDGYDAAEPEVMLVNEEQIVLGGVLRQNGVRVAGFVASANFDGEIEWVEIIDGTKSSVLSATRSADGTIVALTPGSDPRFFGISPAGELLWQTSVASTQYVAAAGDDLITVTGVGDLLGARYTGLGVPLGAPFAIDAVGNRASLIGLDSGAWIVGGEDEGVAYVASYGSDDSLEWRTNLPEAHFYHVARDSQGDLWIANNDADIISGDGGQLVKLAADGSVLLTVPFAGYFQALGVDSADFVVTQDNTTISEDQLTKRDPSGEQVWSIPIDGMTNTSVYAIGFRPSDQQMILLGSQPGGVRVLRSHNR